MSKILNKAVKTTLIVLIIATALMFFLASFNFPKFYLSKTHKVKSNLLIVEGWLPPYALEMAYKEFQNNKYDLIITSGFKFSAYDFCMVASNGYHIFYPRFKPDLHNDFGKHTIEVVTFSAMSGFYGAHFNFFVNDSLVGDFIADSKVRRYGINWVGYLKDIDSLIIQFDNDYYDENGDRNLYVKEIIIDNRIRIPYQFNSELDTGPLDGNDRIDTYTYFESSAEFCRDQMITFGIDSAIIIAVPCNKAFLNRTLSSVLTIRNWLKETDKTVTGINIVSLGIHARRTWISYRKVLGNNIEIGIISLQENEDPKSKFKESVKILNEILGIIYYKIILTLFF